MSKITQWHTYDAFSKVIATGYSGDVTIEILSIEEFSPSQIDATGGECLEDHRWVETAWEVKSRNIVTTTGYTIEEVRETSYTGKRHKISSNRRPEGYCLRQMTYCSSTV